VATMTQLFGPLARHIVRKRAALEKVRADVAEHARLVGLLAKCKDIASEAGLLAQLEALEVDDKYLAFAKEPDQHRYILAASFSDQWTEVTDEAGGLVGGICSWYVCRARTAWSPSPPYTACECLRLIPSKDWKRKHTDPLAPKQRYYCGSGCEARYNASWGQVVEVARVCTSTREVERFYMRADVPSWDVEDIRAMELEASLPVSSAEDLYSRVKRVEPSLNDVIVKDAEGFKRVRDPATFNALPEFKWAEIFNLAGAPVPAVVAGKKSKR
jgi:hypothetical protein